MMIAKAWRTIDKVGFTAAALYVTVVAAAYIFALAGAADPGAMGMAAIPFAYLTMPWSRLGWGMAFPGIAANALFLYACGTLFHLAWRHLEEETSL